MLLLWNILIGQTVMTADSRECANFARGERTGPSCEPTPPTGAVGSANGTEIMFQELSNIWCQ